ncbi:hypothetical protein AGMMS50293_03820 [Spirochaetia bacterium]|nr:hypothetical protein AGMMS50293_03820 [Spirochaetia bacterium]
MIHTQLPLKDYAAIAKGDSTPANCPVCHVAGSQFREQTADDEKRVLTSITKLNIQYAHRFLGYIGEAQYLHGHTGTLTIEVEGGVNTSNGFAVDIKKLTFTSGDNAASFCVR